MDRTNNIELFVNKKRMGWIHYFVKKLWQQHSHICRKPCAIKRRFTLWFLYKFWI